MFESLTRNFRRVQLQLSLIFSLVTLVIIIGYSALLVVGHRQARWRFEANVRRQLTGDYQEAHFVKESCVPPLEPYDREPPAETLSLAQALKKNWVIFDRRVYGHLIIFDTLVWLVASVSGYFFIGWLLRPVRAMTQSQQEFIANASHELKTPITTIKTEISLLDGEKMSASVREGLATIKGENQNLQNMVAKLLLALRQGQKDVPVARVAVTKLLKPLLARYQKVYRDRHIDFILESPKDVMLETKAEFLGQIVELLLDNAGKYAKIYSSVRVSVRCETEWVHIEVVNQGPGIDESEKQLIGQRFYRATKKEIQGQIGSGLGLAMAQDLTRLLRGRLVLVSGRPEQTVFRLSLPYQYYWWRRIFDNKLTQLCYNRRSERQKDNQPKQQ